MAGLLNFRNCKVGNLSVTCESTDYYRHKLMSTTAETLTLIWQRMLQHPVISVEENFFDMGGNEALADVLFAEISQLYGRQLPSAMLGRAHDILETSAAAICDPGTRAAFLDQLLEVRTAPHGNLR